MLSEEIFAEFKRGRLEQFYILFYPGLLQYALRHLNEKKMYAEDCVQNAVYKAWQRKEKFDSENTLKAFLYITIRNEIISIHRNSSAKERFLQTNLDLERYDSFINSIIDQEARTILFKYLLQLPERERKVAVLSYLEGLSHDEIARKMGISLATVKRAKTKALEFLRSVMKNLLIVLFSLLSI